MKRLLSVIVFICLCFSLISCSNQPKVIREQTSLSGASSGDTSFVEGNIKFTIPENTHYNLTQNEIVSDYYIGVSICYLGGYGSSIYPVATETIIGSQRIDSFTYTEDPLNFKKESLYDKYSDYTQTGDLTMSVSGKDVVFNAFKESKSDPALILIACFSDSSYIYTAEVTINDFSEKACLPFMQMFESTEYIGTDKLDEFNQ